MAIEDRAKYKDGAVYVARNHENYVNGQDDAVHMALKTYDGTVAFSTHAAREIAAALNAAADSFDALKPDPQTEFVAKLESLGLGAVVEGRVHAVRLVKIHRGNWIASRGAVFGSSAIDHIEYEIISEGVK